MEKGALRLMIQAAEPSSFCRLILLLMPGISRKLFNAVTNYATHSTKTKRA